VYQYGWRETRIEEKKKEMKTEKKGWGQTESKKQTLLTVPWYWIPDPPLWIGVSEAAHNEY
jgi:hypothetical protein